MPREGMHTIELGFEVNSGGDPIHILQQVFEALQPLLPLVLDAFVGVAEGDHIGVQVVDDQGFGGKDKHLAAEERPVFDAGERGKYAAVDVASVPRLFHIGGESDVLDTAVDDGLLRH